MNRRALLATASALAMFAAIPAEAKVAMKRLFNNRNPSPPPGLTGFANIGAGGFIVGGDISDDGLTMVCKADTYNCYKWSIAQNKWIGLITPASIGNTYQTRVTYNPVANVWDIHIARANNNRFYGWFAYDATSSYCVWRSDNQGTTWTVCNSAALNINNTSGQGGYKATQQKIVADPYDSDVVIAGCSGTSTSSTGAYISVDAGATWTKIGGGFLDPNDNGAGVCGIVFDKSGGTVVLNRGNGNQTVCASIMIPSSGRGVYRSTDGGVTFSLLSGSPTDVWNAANIHTGTYAGSYWCCNAALTQTWKWTPSVAFARIQIPYDTGNPPTTDLPSGACCPLEGTGDIIFTSVATLSSGYTVSRTYDNGATFQRTTLAGRAFSQALPDCWGSATITTGDIPYMEFIDPPPSHVSLTNAFAVRAPASSTGKFFLFLGIGVWWSDFPTTWTLFYANGLQYNSQSRGIEQLVINQIVHQPGATKAVVSCADRGVINAGTTYADSWAPLFFQYGANADYASNDLSFMVANCANFGSCYLQYSTAYGQAGTWNSIPVQPTYQEFGGAIACATSTNWIYVNSNFGWNGVPGTAPARAQYTTDGGNTWNLISGFPTNDAWPGDQLVNAAIFAADRVNIGTFYVYLNGYGIYRSTNNGVSFSLVSSALTSTMLYGNGLYACPDTAGFLIVSTPSSGLWKSSDGGVTVTQVPNCTSSANIGWGKKKSGASDMRVIYDGVISNLSATRGLYYTDNISNATPTWTLVAGGANGLPDLVSFINTYDDIRCLAGDLTDETKVYYGTGGSGVIGLTI